MTITKIYAKILSEIFDTRQKNFKKFLTWLIFKFFKNVAIFLKFPINYELGAQIFFHLNFELWTSLDEQGN